MKKQQKTKSSRVAVLVKIMMAFLFLLINNSERLLKMEFRLSMVLLF